MIYLLLSAGTS